MKKPYILIYDFSDNIVDKWITVEGFEESQDMHDRVKELQLKYKKFKIILAGRIQEEFYYKPVENK